MLRHPVQDHPVRHPNPRRGFTLIELLVVIGTGCLLASFIVPALARAKIKSPDVGCLSNLRQMQLGWLMYRDDNNDVLLSNDKGFQQNGWLGNVGNQDWYNASANTNAATYATSVFWPYVGRDVSVFRCPADFKPSQNGYRLRSYSMNGQMGEPNTAQFNENMAGGYLEYQKGSDLTCPTPANAFVFCDESFWTMNDGWLEINAQSPQFPDAPAAYHAGGCGFGFADGHAEIHKWTGPYSMSGTAPVGVRGIPYAFGVVRPGATLVSSSGSDPDWRWLIQHATCTNH